MAQTEDFFKILLKNINAQDVDRGWAMASNFPATPSSLDAINIDEQVLPRELVFPYMEFNLEPRLLSRPKSLPKGRQGVYEKTFSFWLGHSVPYKLSEASHHGF